MSPTCTDCREPMRGTHQTIPGTVRHGGRGFCDRCYKRRKRAQTLPPREVKSNETITGPCGRCGLKRAYKPNRPNADLCSSCILVERHPEPLEECDLLTCGRWVNGPRGVLVWREYTAA